MLTPCVRCGAALQAEAIFCSSCGSPVPDRTPSPSHLSGSEPASANVAPAQAAPILRVFIDSEAMRHFLVETRCAIRLRIDNFCTSNLSVVSVYAKINDGQKLAPVRSGIIAPDKSEILTLWLVPPIAGFYELDALLVGVTAAKERRYARLSGLQFRVGAPSDAQRVSVVNIDQRSARVVDNSRTSFALPTEDLGGLVSGGDWHEVSLLELSGEDARQLAPEAVPSAQAEAEAEAEQRRRAMPARSSGPINFTVRAERGSYDVHGILAQGDIATVYDGRRSSDGVRVAVKLVDDEADNDLMHAEVAALTLLHGEQSPQSKHLPVVLDRFHTRDGRMGTVFPYLDGFDLTEVRRRLPQGLSARHFIWVMRRCLSVLGWVHSRGVLHGNLDPAHIMLRPGDHNVWMIDWCYAIVNPAQSGQGFRCLNETYSPPEVAARKPPLPSSDLYALGKSMFFLLGGDPQTKTLPEEIDARLQRFLQYCVLESALSRASDAWEAYRQLDRLREDIWGPHQFIELNL